MINVRLATKEDKTDVLRLLDEFLTHVGESQGSGSHEPVEIVGSNLFDELIVTKSMRGKWAGAKLLEAVKDYCKTNNILSLRLNSEVSLTDAHKFYEAHGGKFTDKMFRFNL